MIGNVTSNPEVYSLGINGRLAQSHIARLATQLENAKEITEMIAASVVERQASDEPNGAAPGQLSSHLIDGYIERSRKTINERIKDRAAEKL